MKVKNVYLLTLWLSHTKENVLNLVIKKRIELCYLMSDRSYRNDDLSQIYYSYEICLPSEIETELFIAKRD